MSASSDTQFGFNFDQNFEEEPREQELPQHNVAVAEPPTAERESEQPCPDCNGDLELCSNEECNRYREPREPEQPPLFEGFAPVKKEEPEIPWTQYVRMVQMFFDGPKFEEFRGQVSKLAVQYGTKNLTDTVAEAVRREAH